MLDYQAFMLIANSHLSSIVLGHKAFKKNDGVRGGQTALGNLNYEQTEKQGALYELRIMFKVRNPYGFITTRISF